MSRVPPDRVEHVIVDGSPQSLHVPQPEPEQVVELVEFDLRQAPLCLRAQVIGGDKLMLRSAPPPPGELCADFSPRKSLHLAQESDDLA